MLPPKPVMRERQVSRNKYHKAAQQRQQQHSILGTFSPFFATTCKLKAYFYAPCESLRVMKSLFDETSSASVGQKKQIIGLDD